MNRLVALGAALTAGLLPSLALACPQCAGRITGGPLETAALGAFLFLPFAASGVVVKIIRAHRDDDDGHGRVTAGAERYQDLERPVPALASTWQQDRKRREAE